MKHFEREALIWTSGLDAESKLLLLALNQYLGSNESAWPSTDRLAQDTSLHKRTVLRRIDSLKDKEIVAVKHRYTKGMQTSSEYAINWTTLGIISITANPKLSDERGDSQSLPENQGCQGVTAGTNRVSEVQYPTTLNYQGCQGVTPDLVGVTGSHQGVTGSHPDLIHRTNPIGDLCDTAHGDPNPLPVEQSAQPITQPCGERVEETSTCGEDVAPSASATGEVKEEPIKPKSSNRKKRPSGPILTGEDVKRVRDAYNQNKSPYWSELKTIGTDRERILRKWLNDLGSLDAVIEIMVKALKFAAQDEFWSGKTGDARRLNFETLNDKGHFISWSEDYDRIHQPKPVDALVIDSDLQAKFDHLKTLAERVGQKAEPFMGNRFLFNGKIQRLESETLDLFIDQLSRSVKEYSNA